VKTKGSNHANYLLVFAVSLALLFGAAALLGTSVIYSWIQRGW
jgi:hypothetical protein